MMLFSLNSSQSGEIDSRSEVFRETFCDDVIIYNRCLLVVRGDVVVARNPWRPDEYICKRITAVVSGIIYPFSV